MPATESADSVVDDTAETVTEAEPDTTCDASITLCAADTTTAPPEDTASPDSVMLADADTKPWPPSAAMIDVSNHPDATALSENHPAGSAFLSNSPTAIYFSITAKDPDMKVAVVAEAMMLCSRQVPL